LKVKSKEREVGGVDAAVIDAFTKQGLFFEQKIRDIKIVIEHRRQAENRLGHLPA